MSNLLSASPAVIAAIDGELAYINTLDRTTADHGVAGQLVALAELVQQANRAWYSEFGDQAALDVIRKIAAAAVRALILYGCPERVIPKDQEQLLLEWFKEYGDEQARAANAAKLATYVEEKALRDAVNAMKLGGFTIDEASLRAIATRAK